MARKPSNHLRELLHWGSSETLKDGAQPLRHISTLLEFSLIVGQNMNKHQFAAQQP
jgi:hypothetical protein